MKGRENGPLRQAEAKERRDAQAAADREDAQLRNEGRAARVAPVLAHLANWAGATVVTSADLKPYSSGRSASAWDVEIDGFTLRVTASDTATQQVRVSIEQVSDDGQTARFIERPWQLLEPWEKSHPTNPGKGTA